MTKTYCDLCEQDCEAPLKCNKFDLCQSCADAAVRAAFAKVARKCPDCAGYDAIGHDCKWPEPRHVEGCKTVYGRRGWRTLGEYDG